MGKVYPNAKLHVIEVLRNTDGQDFSYLLNEPYGRGMRPFGTIIAIIRHLRTLRTSRAYLVDDTDCFELRWGPLISPWEGPRK